MHSFINNIYVSSIAWMNTPKSKVKQSELNKGVGQFEAEKQQDDASRIS